MTCPHLFTRSRGAIKDHLSTLGPINTAHKYTSINKQLYINLLYSICLPLLLSQHNRACIIINGVLVLVHNHRTTKHPTITLNSSQGYKHIEYSGNSSIDEVRSQKGAKPDERNLLYKQSKALHNSTFIKTKRTKQNESNIL